jgi:hypothetical protein
LKWSLPLPIAPVSRGMVIDAYPRYFDQVNQWLGRNPLKYLD